MGVGGMFINAPLRVNGSEAYVVWLAGLWDDML